MPLTEAKCFLFKGWNPRSETQKSSYLTGHLGDSGTAEIRELQAWIA